MPPEIDAAVERLRRLGDTATVSDVYRPPINMAGGARCIWQKERYHDDIEAAANELLTIYPDGPEPAAVELVEGVRGWAVHPMGMRVIHGVVIFFHEDSIQFVPDDHHHFVTCWPKAVYATEPEARLALQWQLWHQFREAMARAKGEETR